MMVTQGGLHMRNGNAQCNSNSRNEPCNSPSLQVNVPLNDMWGCYCRSY